MGEDFALAQKDKLYCCLDRLLVLKRQSVSYFTERWHSQFDARFDILLYDLTNTYFESDPPEYRGDCGLWTCVTTAAAAKRPDCVQAVIALIVTPEGFPLAYEVMPGNTADNNHAGGFPQEDRRSIRARRASG